MEGFTRDLKGLRVVTSSYVNGVPKTHLELEEGVRSHAFGSGPSFLEEIYLGTVFFLLWQCESQNAVLASSKVCCPLLCLTTRGVLWLPPACIYEFNGTLPFAGSHGTAQASNWV